MIRIERLTALIWKEWLQVFRDPSALMIAFLLPLIMIFLFGYGLSLDATSVKLGVALEDSSPTARSFFNALDASRYFSARYYTNRADAEAGLCDGDVRAVLVIPNDFSKRVEEGTLGPAQLLVDGADANTALIVENYATAAYAQWSAARLRELRGLDGFSKINLETRTIYNPEQSSRNCLVPGSTAIVLAMIGTLLTCMVVAREWERGTMEATLATPIGRLEMFLGKMIPYFLLGLAAALENAAVARYVLGVPFRGSILAFVYASGAFLFVATAQGVLISSVCRDQNLASQVALISSFLPNYILSGVLFEIDAMPKALQMITYLFPARYYVVCLQTIFMAGDGWSLLNRQIGCIAVIGVVFCAAAIAKTPRRL